MSWSLATACPPCALISAATSEAGVGVAPAAVVGDAAIVDHDGDALSAEQQGVLAPEPATGAGDDGDATLEFDHPHPFYWRPNCPATGAP